jgi:hypothetical protein
MLIYNEENKNSLLLHSSFLEISEGGTQKLVIITACMCYIYWEKVLLMDELLIVIVALLPLIRPNLLFTRVIDFMQPF